MSNNSNSYKTEQSSISLPISIEQNSSDLRACGDRLSCSESGVELKSLLKLIDNVIEMSPATDEEPQDVPEDFQSIVIEKGNPFMHKTPLTSPQKFSSRFQTPSKFEKACPTDEDGRVTLSEVLMVPVKKYPKYNFVGRILGPRGMTVKQLEKETGCKIFVRGRASSTTFNPHTKSTRLPFNLKNTLSTISQCALTEEPLHVFIECTDYPVIATNKLAHAVSVINDLLSPPADGKDELKRQQLVDISLINGTYRATSSSQDILRPFRRFGQTVDPTSNPADGDVQPINFEHSNSGVGDLGAVFGITQQKRIWQKPRGPDVSTEEFAKSVSSREYVSDIVNKTKNIQLSNASEDSLFNLPQSVVSETLKVAKNLLASHQHLTFGSKPPSQEVNPKDSKMSGAGDGKIKTVWKKELPLYPPPLMPNICAPSLPFHTDFPYPPLPYPDFPMPHNNHFFMVPPPSSPFPRRY